MIFTYRYCRMLEEGSFRGRTADFVLMMVGNLTNIKVDDDSVSIFCCTRWYILKMEGLELLLCITKAPSNDPLYYFDRFLVERVCWGVPCSAHCCSLARRSPSCWCTCGHDATHSYAWTSLACLTSRCVSVVVKKGSLYDILCNKQF